MSAILLALWVVLSFVVGIGWAGPCIVVSLLRSILMQLVRYHRPPVPNRFDYADEMAFMACWFLLQTIAGALTIVGLPLGFVFLSFDLMLKILLSYTFVAMISGVVFVIFFFKDQQPRR